MDIIKKASLVTAELISLSADKVQEVADDFVKKGTLHDSEAKKFVSEVRHSLESREKEFNEKVQQIAESIQQLGNTLGLTKVEKENLDNRIDELEKHIDDLKNRREALKEEPEAVASAKSTAKAKK